MGVKIWKEIVEIPTYEAGETDPNPMFLEKRVYQGSSGKVYPYPVIHKISNEKKDKPYNIIFLENEFIQIQIMPEIGGRIYRALDKTNNYDFVYYNHVIKPALVGLTGPWISGGIEFNWPQHHRPNTYGNVEYRLSENNDGSATVWIAEIDKMYGTKVTTGFTLHPGKSYIEIKAQMYNRTSQPQTFLWWANPAVAVHDETQSIFPPDVHAVFDHGKRDVSTFPIATGVYYKQDYSRGVDISRYKNIHVPTSYMAYHSDYNFVGGFDYRKNAGILHIANHHVSPGKKQWTWGCGDFGKAWDRNLTDEDGSYIELMTGVYTDNQPDFTFLMPYEEKSFTQYFMPYKAVGQVKNASVEVAVGLTSLDNKKTKVCVYASSLFTDATIQFIGKNQTYLNKIFTLSPNNIFEETVDVSESIYDLTLIVSDNTQREMISYTEKNYGIVTPPNPAKAIGKPEELDSPEALYLAGMHLEQYRHATYDPSTYYLEGLKRSPSDIRLNLAYGEFLLKQCDFAVAEKHFEQAVKTATRHNTNLHDGEPYFNLGKLLKLQGKLKEAFDVLYKSTWSANCAGKGYFLLAQIAFETKNYMDALELVNRCLDWQFKNYKARCLKSNILRKLGKFEEAKNLIKQTIDFDYMYETARYELAIIENSDQLKKELFLVMGADPISYIELSADYAECGDYAQAQEVLEYAITISHHPMLYYYLAYCSKDNGWLKKASEASPKYCFPNTILDSIVLEYALNQNPEDDKAQYYLGNLLYDKKRFDKAIELWEKSIKNNNSYATVKRNLALAYVNKKNDLQSALKLLEEAFDLNKNDSRVFYELDQLYKKMSYSFKERLEKMEQNIQLVNDRDDLFLEYITLQNSSGEFEKALTLILSRQFHPWEGGEGKIPTQYILANVELSKIALKKNKPQKAIEYLEAAKIYPPNIGEGKLSGAQENNIDFYLGCAYEQTGNTEQAEEFFRKAGVGLSEPASAMFYNDQPPHMIFYQGLAHLKLRENEQAKSRFNKLIDYGEKHIYDKQSIDYFAISLPDFLVFEDDLDRRNEVHCNYMMGLGYIGLKKYEKAKQYLLKTLELEPNHQGAAIHLELCKKL